MRRGKWGTMSKFEEEELSRDIDKAERWLDGTDQRATGDNLPCASEGESPDHGLRGDGEDSYAQDARGEA
jgi:hypothetical protein